MLADELQGRLEAARHLAHVLMSSRAAQPPEARAGSHRVVRAKLVVDATLVGADGGTLAPLLLLVAEAWRRCNFAVDVLVSGPRELLDPHVAQAAGSGTHDPAAMLHHVLCSSVGDSPSPSDVPPDLVLCVTPPKADNLTPLPLPLTSQ